LEVTVAHSLGVVQKRFPKVTKVIDSRKPLKVTVGRQDTSLGKKKKHEDCAMAVACKRKFKLDGVIISVSRAYLIKGNTAVRFEVPESVSREITSFDRGSDFVPGEYGLDPVAKRDRLGSVKGTRHSPRTSKGRPIRRYHRTENIRAALGSKADE
jgi:hypothetical protein